MTVARLTQFKDGRQCLAFYLDGKRHRETFANLREAQRRKGEVEKLKGKGQKIDTKKETAQDASTQYAINLLTQEGIQKPLTAVVDEYTAAVKILKGQGTLVEACEAFVNNQDKIVPIKVSDLVADYDRYLIGQKVGEDHRDKTINIYLKRFAAAFQMGISLITLKDLETWRATFTSSPRTVNNYCNAVKALFNYAKDHNHVRKDRVTEASKLKDIEETPTEANPFTLEEMAILLSEADEKSLPYIVLGAFAGIRTAEQKRLRWEKHVRWDTGYFDLTGNVTKKKLRRLVPILPAAAAWLTPYKNRKGLILDEAHPERYPTEILRKRKLDWRHNGLRDAFGSNRAAILKNLNEVAMEMGNSPDMVIESYREVFTKEQAEKFWLLTPEVAKKLAKSLAKVEDCHYQAASDRVSFSWHPDRQVAGVHLVGTRGPGRWPRPRLLDRM
jgi:integrase